MKKPKVIVLAGTKSQYDDYIKCGNLNPSRFVFGLREDRKDPMYTTRFNSIEIVGTFFHRDDADYWYDNAQSLLLGQCIHKRCKTHCYERRQINMGDYYITAFFCTTCVVNFLNDKVQSLV